LHPADGSRLIATLKRLRDLDNTIIIVEHDEAMMRAADHIIDMGPGAGKQGGEVVATGTLQDIIDCPHSITGQYLSRTKQIPLPPERRSGSGNELVIQGARENNLKNIDVHIPLGKFVGITGVSGSGKSSLINEVLYKRLARLFYRAKERPGKCDGILGALSILIRWSTLTNHRLAGPREATRPLIPGHSPLFENFSPLFLKLECVVIPKDAFPST